MPTTSRFYPYYAVAASGERLSLARVDRLTRLAEEAEPGEIAAFAALALDLKRRRFADRVGLCAIVNAKSGGCSEDCAFCAQSAHYRTGAPVYPFVDLETILAAARRMRASGATRFGVVLSGKALEDEDFELLLEAVAALRAEGIIPDASCGLLDPGQLAALRLAGMDAYHHNLETARSYFPAVCTSHDYREDVAAVKAALAAGLNVCSGGIFGLGENFGHRAELALTLRDLGVASVPVNFLTPIPGTPLEDLQPLSPGEAMRILALLRFILPSAHIRLCGGRQLVFGPGDKNLGLQGGASGVMIGDYLTVAGADPQSDLEDLARLGLTPEDAASRFPG
ncbi:MAG: biotin synthase BioB [Desulfovibrionaceae bacterium]|nr:biotin synthase BioB [Desulfovibrionaceae bacterium]MBF0514487.1 biotin synthase BioB [Desulfovibrionaceae bacterium]